MRRIIVTESKKCDGCGVCELICSVSKEGVYNRRLSRIRVVNIEPKIDVAIACRFCENPTCVNACPRNALHQNSNGVIVVDENKCTGCSWCIEACDFGAIVIHPKSAVMMCDLCEGKPKCIDWCPTKALQLEAPTTITQKARISILKKIFS